MNLQPYLQPVFRLCWCLVFGVWCFVLTGCRDNDHAHSRDENERGEHRSSAPDSGFQEELGVFVSETTKTTLGVQTSEAIEKTLPQRAEAIARIYAPGRATASLDSVAAATLAPGSCVTLGAAGPFTTTGTVARLDRQLQAALGQVEALIEFTGAGENRDLAPGRAIAMTFEAAGKPALAVPESSVLQTGGGSFLFLSKNGHFRRTRVEPQARAEGWVQIAGPVQPGDLVVTNGVQRLWCIELQATKAGAACCPADEK
jgi:hypothetical protein